jgi:HPt (histidine-containing phosphotransfer) domain-containing protein
MPEMDGYEATAVIRDANSKVLDHGVPIIALTAHAMHTDRRKCLEAGMNDYMAKPIRPDELTTILDRWLPDAREPASPGSGSVPLAQVASTPGATDQEIFNEADLLERLMGDKDLAHAIAAGFLDDIAKQLVSLRSCVETVDHSAVRRLAHTIKGAAANVGAPQLKSAAQRMEKAAGEGRPEEVERLLRELEWRYTQVTEIMRRESNVS